MPRNSFNRQIRRFLDAIALKLHHQDFSTEEQEMTLEGVLCPHNQKAQGVPYPMLDQVVGEAERAKIFEAMDKTHRTPRDPRRTRSTLSCELFDAILFNK